MATDEGYHVRGVLRNPGSPDLYPEQRQKNSFIWALFGVSENENNTPKRGCCNLQRCRCHKKLCSRSAEVEEPWLATKHHPASLHPGAEAFRVFVVFRPLKDTNGLTH